MSPAPRLIGLLLLLYPRSFRERYGEELVAFHVARTRTRISAGAFVRIILDHVRSALLLRLGFGRRFGEERRGRLGSLQRDIHYAVRTLRRRPSFTVVVLFTLALGVGANGAIFAVLNGILLRPLPYPDASALVSFRHAAPQLLTSQPEYMDYRTGMRSLVGLAAFTEGEANLLTLEEPERVAVAAVTPDFFGVLRVPAGVGRTFAAGDDEPAAPAVAILSDALWQRRFGGDRGVIGQSIQVNGRLRTVIGVMPRDFDYPRARTDVWLPLPRIRADSLGDRAHHYLDMIGRLRSGSSPSEALAEATRISRGMLLQNPTRYDPQNPPVPLISRVTDNLTGATRPYLLALFGAVSVVLMIVCANVASMVLARSGSRGSEMGVRLALGASPRQLLGQLLVESLVLSFIGGVLALGVAWSAHRALIAMAPATIPRLDEISLDWRVVVYIFVVSMVAGVAFGIVPALRAAKTAPVEMIRRATRAGTDQTSRRMHEALVIAEVALAVVILAGGGLLLRSLLTVRNTDLGFEPAGALTMKVSLPQTSYDEQRATQFYELLLSRVATLPGVVAAGASATLPVIDQPPVWGVLAEGQSYERLQQGPTAVPQQVTPGYFDAMGLKVSRGRAFTQYDRATGPFVAVINDALANELWPGQDPLGRRLRVGGAPTFMTVVGVVADTRLRGYNGPPEPVMYVPHAQTATTAYFMPRTLSLIVRSAGDPLAVSADVRAIIRSLDSTVPISSVQTLERVVGESYASRQFATVLIIAFASLALILAAVGIFGVTAHGVAQRTYEIGVRIALGADRGTIVGVIARESAAIALSGLAIGIAGALALAHSIRSLLVDVPAVDIVTLGVVSLLLACAVLLATIVPARRAVAIEPTRALRGG